MSKVRDRLTVDRSHTLLIGGILVVLALLATVPAWSVGYTTDFLIGQCSWSHKGTQNPYFSLRPGDRLILEGEEDDAEIEVQITVLRRTEVITFETSDGEELTVRARVVEEMEWEDGELVEVSHNWFARCVQTSDIYYFGEEVDIYEDGEIVSHDGAWRAGEDDAMPGIIMPGTYLLGSKYFQEIAPDVAMDRAKHIDMDLDVMVPAGSFSQCVAVKETTPLAPGEESFKVYCPGVGLVIDDVVDLVERERVPANQ